MAKQARYKTLQSNGPIFPAEYKPQGYKLAGDKLAPLAEEMLWNAARYIDSDYWDRLIKTGNFFACLKPELNAIQKNLIFGDKNYMVLLQKMKQDQDALKEAKKQKSKEEKLAEKKEKEDLREIYGFAEVDGQKVPLGSYQIEPPGIIMTRGADPRFGNWKYRVEPKDVALNIVKGKAPKDWKGTTYSDPTSQYVAIYKVTCGVQKSKTYKVLNKNIAFAPFSTIRQKNNVAKFDKASNILKNWKKIQKHIYDGCLKGNESALVAYLIQETGIRIGNERDLTKQSDTQGASTLRNGMLTCFIEED